MLILTRKLEESIIIDGHIKVKILEVDNNRVQLGIEAPKSVSIHREEVFKEIQSENKRAAFNQQLSPDMLKSVKKKVEDKEKKE